MPAHLHTKIDGDSVFENWVIRRVMAQIRRFTTAHRSVLRDAFIGASRRHEEWEVSLDLENHDAIMWSNYVETIRDELKIFVSEAIEIPEVDRKSVNVVSVAFEKAFPPKDN